MRVNQTYVKDIPRDVYRKLQQHLDTLPIGYPATESGSDLKILKFLFTPEEAFIALNMRYIPEQIKNIYRRVKKRGITLEQLATKLDLMFKKGSIRRVKQRNDDEEIILFQNSPLVVGMFEYQVNRLTKDFYNNFDKYMNETFRDEFTSTKINQLRTIPVEKGITPEHLVANYDELKHLFNHAEIIAVSPCICHQAKKLYGDECEGIEERCFTVNDSAINAVERGYGKFVEKGEAFEIIHKAQEQGMVIQPTNSKNPSYVCCCCDCCDLLANLKKLKKPWELITSNYYAIIDKNLCVGCRSCMDMCKMEAIEVEEIAVINKDRCIGCGNCVICCSEKAIMLKNKENEINVPESTKELMLRIVNKKAKLRRKEKGIE